MIVVIARDAGSPASDKAAGRTCLDLSRRAIAGRTRGGRIGDPVDATEGRLLFETTLLLWASAALFAIIELAGPIWLGDNSSVMKTVIERLYACSSLLNNKG
jgi:hypothetical protein